MKQWSIFLLVLAAVLCSATGLVYAKHLNRKMFVELSQLQQERDRLITEFGQLQLEQSTWATHGRVESAAHQQLNMRIPGFRVVEIVHH